MQKIRTQHFDIIYPEECVASAKKIAAVADGYLDEIAGKLNYPLEKLGFEHFPVTLTRQVQMTNAYFTAIFYNRIVLYDNPPENNLDMFERPIESIFYHELTHAVTFNMKSAFWRGMSSVFADVLNPAWLSLSQFWSEGATVSFESADGLNGRLNDPYSTQIVYQAILENRFPSWRDVTGARDTPPGGSDSYIFGSMFARYLQETYGMEKYGEFWKNAGTWTSLSFVAGVFKKTYGISVTSAWKDFKSSLMPLTLDLAANQDDYKFFAPAPYKNKNTKVSCLANFDGGFYFYDSASKGIFFCKKTIGSYEKAKKVMFATGITSLSASSDGRFLAVGYYKSRSNVKSEIFIWDTKNDEKIYPGGNGLRSPAVVRADGKYFLAAYNFAPGKNEITIFALNEKNAFDGEKISLPLENDEIVTSISPSFASDGGENFSCIIKNGLYWRIDSFSADGKKIASLKVAQPLEGLNDGLGLILHNLHAAKNENGNPRLYFSWAQIGLEMLPRPAYLEFSPEGEKIFFASYDYSGAFGDCFFDGSNLLSAADFYETSKVYWIPAEKIDFYEGILIQPAGQGEDSLPEEEGQDLSTEKSGQEKINVLSYNPFSYCFRGAFIPLGQVGIYSSDLKQSFSGLLGATYMTSDPWCGLRTSVTGGYSPLAKAGGGGASFTAGNDMAALSMSGSVTFDSGGFLQTYNSASTSVGIFSRSVFSLKAGAEGSYFYGKAKDTVKDPTDSDKRKVVRSDDRRHAFSAYEYLIFSTLHTVRPGYSQIFGFYVKPFLNQSRKTKITRVEAKKYYNCGATVGFCLPGPFPLSASASIFPEQDYCASFSGKLILHDFEIQRGIPAVSFYLNRIVLFASYTGKISYESEKFWDIRKTNTIVKEISADDYSDTISAGCEFQLTPNTGFFASSNYLFSLGGKINYHINREDDERRIDGSLLFNMNF